MELEEKEGAEPREVCRERERERVLKEGTRGEKCAWGWWSSREWTIAQQLICSDARRLKAALAVGR